MEQRAKLLLALFMVSAVVLGGATDAQGDGASETQGKPSRAVVSSAIEKKLDAPAYLREAMTSLPGVDAARGAGLPLKAGPFPEAVIEVNEARWVDERRALGYYTEVTPTRSYAPFPVLFEGWKSTPDIDKMADYAWDFGPGTETDVGGRYFHGFNAAHVFETPGQYTVWLTVTDAFGQTASDSITVQVLARDGTTYYVDSVLGDDANTGTSTGSGAWRTATRAFSGVMNSRYGPGDQILFRRGQTFEVRAGVIVAANWRTGYGFAFGTYGTGDKPLIQLAGTDAGIVLNMTGAGLAHASWSDLVFDLTSAQGATASFYNGSGISEGTLFLRCDIREFYHGMGWGGNFSTSEKSGVFVVGCSMYDALMLHLYAKCSRLALFGNDMDLAGNHIAYLSAVNVGVVSANTFSRPSFGRHALRLCGTAEVPYTNHVLISDNAFIGWRDTRLGGTRYNFLLVHLAPNDPEFMVMRDVIFENNTLQDAETLLNIGGYENLVVRNNSFSSVDTYNRERIILGGFHGFDMTPIKNLLITQNTIIVRRPEIATAPVFLLRNYTGPAYEGRIRHENIVIDKNVIVMDDGPSPLLRFEDDFTTDPQQIAEVITDNLVVFNTSEAGLFQVANGATTFSLADWRARTGHDIGTQVYIPDTLPVPGWASAIPWTYDLPIRVTYSGAYDNTGTGLAEVRLWAKEGAGDWRDTGLTATWIDPWTEEPTQGETGYFDYEVTVPGVPVTCHFALQARDNAGQISPPPRGNGHTIALYGSEPSLHVVPSSCTLFDTEPVQTADLSAESTEVLDVSFYWESEDQSVVTIVGDPFGPTAVIAAVGEGTAEIRCTGAKSGLVGTATVTVSSPYWYDSCSINDAFQSEGALLAESGGFLGLPSDFDDFDIEAGGGDGVPDSWQLTLLAYTLCIQGGYEFVPDKAVDGTSIVAEFLSNATLLDNLASQWAVWNPFFKETGLALKDVAYTLSLTACDVESTDPDMVALAAALSALLDIDPPGLPVVPSLVFDALGDLMLDTARPDDFIAALPEMREVLTGLLGLSADMRQTVLVGLLATDMVDILLEYCPAIAALLNTVDTDCIQGIPLPPVSDEIAAVVSLLEGAPTFTPPAFAIYGQDGAHEPFAGLGDYNEDLVLNWDVAMAVRAGRGDAYDFVAGATGAFGPFWVGNPALPTVGGAGLGITVLLLLGAGHKRARQDGSEPRDRGRR